MLMIVYWKFSGSSAVGSTVIPEGSNVSGKMTEIYKESITVEHIT